MSGGWILNEKFFALPVWKQEKIINAGFRIFSQNSYKKSPVSEIAEEAGISKSLLFHYFRNKKELYLFLWEKCAQVTTEYLTQYGCYEKENVFEMMYSGLEAKLKIMEQYPDMTNFVIKAFYEQDPEVCEDIRQKYQQAIVLKNNKSRLKLDPEMFIPGLDLSMMYREMFWASEGYLWEMQRKGSVDVKQVEKDFTEMIEFWKKVYLRKEG